MSKIKALLENEETVKMLSEHEELLQEANASFDEFYDIMAKFVAENIEEFLDENLEETSKNVYTFATFATAQYLSELSTMYGKKMEELEEIREAREHEFV